MDCTAADQGATVRGGLSIFMESYHISSYMPTAVNNSMILFGVSASATTAAFPTSLEIINQWLPAVSFTAFLASFRSKTRRSA